MSVLEKFNKKPGEKSTNFTKYINIFHALLGKKVFSFTLTWPFVPKQNCVSITTLICNFFLSTPNTSNIKEVILFAGNC